MSRPVWNAAQLQKDGCNLSCDYESVVRREGAATLILMRIVLLYDLYGRKEEKIGGEMVIFQRKHQPSVNESLSFVDIGIHFPFSVAVFGLFRIYSK